MESVQKNQKPRPIHVVLVGTLYSRNLGSCSRVMANLGADRLIAIQPNCGFDLEARQGAAGAQTRLVEMTTYNSWDEFFKSEPEGLRIAFCGRSKADTDTLTSEDRAKIILEAHDTPSTTPLYLIFGREDHGLEDPDLEYANHIVRLPVYGEFESYNLSHAVMLALYIFKTAEKSLIRPDLLNPVAADPQDDAEQKTDDGRFYFPKQAIEDWLKILGFQIGNRRRDVFTVLKRILLGNHATGQELRMLEAVIHQTVRKLKSTDKKGAQDL